MRKILAVGLGWGAGLGCYQWHHAPGHAAQADMVKHELRVVTGRFCHSGACDKQGPGGRFAFSNVWFLALNGARETTRFDIAHQGVRARCDTGRRGSFGCSITERTGDRYELALADGCLDGTLSRPGTDAWWSIQTDRVTIGGHVAPAREVALVDDAGPVAFVQASADDNLDVFTRRGSAPAAPLLVAVVAVQAFLQLDGLPAACLTRS